MTWWKLCLRCISGHYVSQYCIIVCWVIEVLWHWFVGCRLLHCPLWIDKTLVFCVMCQILAKWVWFLIWQLLLLYKVMFRVARHPILCIDYSWNLLLLFYFSCCVTLQLGSTGKSAKSVFTWKEWLKCRKLLFWSIISLDRHSPTWILQMMALNCSLRDLWGCLVRIPGRAFSKDLIVLQSFVGFITTNTPINYYIIDCTHHGPVDIIP